MNSTHPKIEECGESTLLLYTNEYYTPFLCFFGAAGNCLSVYVFFTTASHRSLTSSYYLSALAISDSGFLLNVFAFWLATVHGLDVVATNISCPIIMYSGQVMGFLSVWFVVAFTVERFFAVCYPLKRPTFCTVSRARRVIAGLSLLALSVSAYVLVIAEVVQVTQHQFGNGTECVDYPNLGDETNTSSIATLGFESDESDSSGNDESFQQLSDSVNASSNCYEMTSFFCTVRSEYHTFSKYANYVDTFLTFILPFCLISFLNFRITLCVWKLKGQRETIVALSKLNNSTNSGTKTSNKSRTTVNMNVVNELGDESPKNTNCNVRQPRNGPRNRSQYSGMNSVSAKRGRRFNATAASSSSTSSSSRGEVRVTKTLLLVSTVFLVFNLPSHAMRVLGFIQNTLIHFQIGCDWRTAQEWSNILFNTNFGVNFLLYCVSGRNFRKSLRNIFCKKKDEGSSRRRTRFLTAKPFLRCPYSRSVSKGRKQEEGRGKIRFQPEAEPGSESMRNPSIHSTTAFVSNSKNRESFYPTCVTEVETYA